MRARCVNKLLSYTRLCIRQATDMSGVHMSVLFCISSVDSLLYAKTYCYAILACNLVGKTRANVT